MIIFWNGYICNRKFFNCYIWNEWTIFINLMCWTTIAFLGSSLFYPDYSLLFSLQGRRAAGAEETETVAVTGVAVPLPFLPLLPTANDDEGGGRSRNFGRWWDLRLLWYDTMREMLYMWHLYLHFGMRYLWMARWHICWRPFFAHMRHIHISDGVLDGVTPGDALHVSH